MMPEPGDFEVVKMGGDSGKLIRVAQFLNGSGFSNYEHARLYIGDGKCVQAEPGGAAIVDYDPNDGGMWSTGAIKLTNDDRAVITTSAVGYARAHVGYSEADYFALAAHRLHMGLLVPGLRDYVESSGHMICSQLVDKCYQNAKIQLFKDGRWNGYVTPGDLAELLFHRWG
jgi:cell wall-associated NlpC family hydrolase